jgi:hypothetical protein
LNRELSLINVLKALASIILRSVAYILVLSAKRPRQTPGVWCVLFVYILCNVGDRAEPCGTPACISLGVDISPSTETTEVLILVIQPRNGEHRKRLLHYCMFSRCRRNNMSTELFSSNGCCTVVCLHSCYFVTGLHVTVLFCRTQLLGVSL